MMQNINIELFSRLFLLNLTNNFKNTSKTNDVCSVVSELTSSSSTHSGSGLEPPTPPRTPVISNQRLSDKIYNNNNEFSKGIYGEHSRDIHDRTNNSESDYEISFRSSTHYRDDLNNSDDEGQQSVVSDMQDGEDSSGEYGSVEKFAMKNFDNFFEKSSLVRIMQLSV